MEEILCRLDVKSLLRYRCVSKSYRSLIDSKRFIKIHHQKSTRDTATLAHHRVLFFSDTRSPAPKFSVCSLQSFIYPSYCKAPSDLNSPEANLLSFIDPSSCKALVSCVEPSSYKSASELNFPTNIPPYKAISIVGCCNGLVCILLERDSNNNGFQFMLWNPSTRISKEVPHINKNKMMVSKEFTYYGFGWDEWSDDYKIVAIVQVEGQSQSQTTSICKIYSLKSDSWKQNDGWDGLSRSWHVIFRLGVLTTGKLQWERWDRAKGYHEWELVAFDLKREVFQMVEQPFSFDDFNPSLGMFGECLALQCTYNDYKEIWVMKEFGVKESWEKVLVLHDFDEYGGIWTSPSVAASYNGGIGIGKGGEFIFMNINYAVKYLAYNQEKKCLYYAPTSINDFETYIHSYIYIESLVSPLE